MVQVGRGGGIYLSGQEFQWKEFVNSYIYNTERMKMCITVIDIILLWKHFERVSEK